MKKNKTNQKVRKAERSLAVNSDENCLAYYLREMNKVPLLSREEEIATAKKAAKGDADAMNKLMVANLRFVVKIAKKYRGIGLPLEDLISEGTIGLIHAVKGYDVEKGYRLISYAVWWIRHHIQKAICEKSRVIRLPQNKVDSLLRIENARKFTHDNQNEKSELLEIAKLVDMDAAQVSELLRIGQDPILLGCPVFEDNNSASMEDFIEDESRINPEDNAIRKIMQKDIESVLGSLKNKEAEIIRARYGLGNNVPMSLEEIGDRYNMSKEGIRQIENRAIQRMRQPSRRSKLEAYVA